MTPENAESVYENISNGADSTSEPPSTEEISRIEAAEWIENPAEVSVEEGFSGSKEIEGEKKDVTLGLLLLGVQDSFKGLVDGLPQVDWLRWWPWRINGDWSSLWRKLMQIPTTLQSKVLCLPSLTRSGCLSESVIL